MKASPYPTGTRLAQHSTSTVVVAALATAGIALAALFVVAYPGSVVRLAALAVAVGILATLAGRTRFRRRRVRRVLRVRVPFTNTVLKI